MTAFLLSFFWPHFALAKTVPKLLTITRKHVYASIMPIKLVITRDHTYAKTAPIKLVITSKCHDHATEPDHVKCGGIAKLSESILKALTAPTRTVHKAAAISA